jgi:glutamate racemase
VPDSRPIGVFDSGVGGLTVARAIFNLLPNERILYLGDNARSPYGPRPLDEIRAFALELAEYLVAREVKMLVVACNAIEVAAIADVTEAHGVPVVGVIDPGVRAAIRATRNGIIGLIGTEATVNSGAYDRALRVAGADVRLLSRACPVFVEHVERGDTSSNALRSAAKRYLGPLLEGGIDALILGCTHYPMLSGLLQVELGSEVVLVSSAEETAKDVYAALLASDLRRDDPDEPRHELLTTGDPTGFQTIAHRFLGPEIGPIAPTEIAHVEAASWS